MDYCYIPLPPLQLRTDKLSNPKPSYVLAPVILSPISHNVDSNPREIPPLIMRQSQSHSCFDNATIQDRLSNLTSSWFPPLIFLNGARVALPQGYGTYFNFDD